jgi:hypothetical protein
VRDDFEAFALRLLFVFLKNPERSLWGSVCCTVKKEGTKINSEFQCKISIAYLTIPCNVKFG